MEATKLQDCSTVAKAFQKKLMSANSEDAVMGNMLPTVAMMQVNSNTVSSNLTNALDPPIPQAVLDVIAGESAAEGPKDDLPVDPEDLLDKAAQMGIEWLEKCIPCNLRLKFRAELGLALSDTLLITLENLLSNYLKELSFVLNMLRAPDVFQDACLLLRSMKDICIPDLQRMISLFAAMLYRETSKEIASIDILKLLITPMFQSLFSGIVTLFSQYKGLITDPLQCVVSNLGFHLDNLKTGGFLTSGQINSIEQNVFEMDKALGGILGAGNLGAEFGIIGSANITEARKAAEKAKRAGDSLDEANQAMQDTLGSAVFHLRKMTMVGVIEVESILGNLEAELFKLIGGSEKENTDFLLRQYNKLLLIRMISFVSALIQALSGGFDCDTTNPNTADEVLGQFFDQYLGPQSSVVLVKDPVSNRIQVQLSNGKFEENAIEALASLNILQDGNPPLIIEPTGDNEVDKAISAIIEQAVSPVAIKPKCFFEDVDDQSKLAQFVADLNATEV